jgi:hypothetical protein
MSESPESESGETCRRATQAAAEVLAENCNDEDFQIRTFAREEMRDESKRQLGLADDADPDCDAVLERGFSDERCSSSPFVQRLVYCMIWEEPPVEEYNQALIDVFGGDLTSAMEQAWRLHDEECRQ